MTELADAGIGLGGPTGYINASIITWTQLRTEPHLLGRTMSFLMLGSVVGAPLSIAGFATSLPRRMV